MQYQKPAPLKALRVFCCLKVLHAVTWNLIFLTVFLTVFFNLQKTYTVTGGKMALTATGIKNIKATDKPAGDKYADGEGMYLLVTKSGMYWRMDYRHADKRKTLALGVYPAVSLAKARQRRETAKELLAEGIDPSQTKRDDKQARAIAASHTFESVARQWLE